MDNECKEMVNELTKLLYDNSCQAVWWDHYNDCLNSNYKKELKKIATVIIKAGYRKQNKD